MTMVTGKSKSQSGKFEFKITSNCGSVVEYGDGYPDVKSVEIAAQNSYRSFHLSNFKVPKNPIENNYKSIEDILEELGI